MKKVFIDTNLWVRFFICDIKDQFEVTKKLLENIEEGSFKAYTSTIVLLELQFVLQRLYHLSFEGILDVFDIVRKTRNITIIEKTNFDLALKFYQQHKIKFPDCLIASQLPKDATLISFDEELGKISEVITKKPQDLLN
ncbi:PIN domain-containing protein [Candidatus Daviesbacteria bacterium]|nr:PIN domain-containing protein [Candidatus Daviesbacteria bacterium]